MKKIIKKIKVYKKIDSKIYINNFDSINNNKISLLDLELFDDFSEIFLLIQKIEEIDFKIKLNSWKSDLKNVKIIQNILNLRMCIINFY